MRHQGNPACAVAAFGLAVMVAAAAPALAGAISPDAVKIEDGVVTTPLTDAGGDPEKGREIFANRKLGNCLACHINADLDELPFHGEVGPPLDGVADRWEEPELRAILVNSKAVFGDATIMPSFYRLENGARTMDKFEGKTILSAEEIEHVLAYLKTLKEE